MHNLLWHNRKKEAKATVTSELEQARLDAAKLIEQTNREL